jgi:hypothetical protein
VVGFTVTPIDCEPVLVFMNCSLATKSLVVSLVETNLLINHDSATANRTTRRPSLQIESMLLVE